MMLMLWLWLCLFQVNCNTVERREKTNTCTRYDRLVLSTEAEEARVIFRFSATMHTVLVPSYYSMCVNSGLVLQ